jgi:hypothetical protein
MAAGGNSSEWLKINHHDTEMAVASAAPGTGAAEQCQFFQCWRSSFEVRLQESLPRGVKPMKCLLLNSITLPFWASPNSSVYEMMLRSEDRSAVRRASSLDPGFPHEDPPQDPPVRPVRPIPTDVPVQEPHDVPVREPMDVPPPNPQNPIKPLPITRPDSKPRPKP